MDAADNALAISIYLTILTTNRHDTKGPGSEILVANKRFLPKQAAIAVISSLL
jgi:hypothetical protein